MESAVTAGMTVSLIACIAPANSVTATAQTLTNTTSRYLTRSSWPSGMTVTSIPKLTTSRITSAMTI
jgi:hypothetical protein